MDLRQVRYFLTVAEKGSISAAAAVLHVAQSAICLLYTSPSPRDS